MNTTKSQPQLKLAENTITYPFHVLVVDDNDADRRALSAQVAALGYRISEADGGQEALDLLATEPVDLVLSELLMQGIDGWDLLVKVEQDYPATHVVVTAGSISEQGAAALKNRYADGWLTKPVQTGKLDTLLKALLLPGNLDRQAQVAIVAQKAERAEEITGALAERGMFATHYDDLREASARIRRNPPDLVITELAVGKKSGFDLCAQLRAVNSTANVPILVLAGNSVNKDLIKKAVSLRIGALVLTPCEAAAVAERAVSLLRSKAALTQSNKTAARNQAA